MACKRSRVRISYSPLRPGAIRVFRITNPAESRFCGICYFCRSQAATMTAIARCRFPTPQTAARTAFRLQYACKQVFRQRNRLELRKIYPKFNGRCIRSRHPVRSLDGTELQTPDDLEFGQASEMADSTNHTTKRARNEKNNNHPDSFHDLLRGLRTARI